MQKIIVGTIIYNGDVFTGDRNQPHYRPGAIAVKDGVIVAVGPEVEILSAYQGHRSIDAAGNLVHPGFIETHLHMTAMAYHGAPFSPTKLDYSTLKAATDPSITAAYSAAAACSMLQRGFTLLFEPGTVFETDAFAEAMTTCGVRAMVSAPYGWDDMSSFADILPELVNGALLSRAPVDAKRVIDQCKREIGRNNDKDALVRGYVGLYGEGTATDDLTREAVRLAADSNVILWQHQSFLPEAVADERKKRGDTGAVRMHRLGALGPSTLLGHMNVLDEADVALIISEKPGISWCPNNLCGLG
ncbi:amidohydrolase family protein [Bradyrhizobium sp. Arg314]